MTKIGCDAYFVHFSTFPMPKTIMDCLIWLGFTSTKHSGPDVGGKQTFDVRIEECTQNPKNWKHHIFDTKIRKKKYIFPFSKKCSQTTIKGQYIYVHKLLEK